MFHFQLKFFSWWIINKKICHYLMDNAYFCCLTQIKGKFLYIKFNYLPLCNAKSELWESFVELLNGKLILWGFACVINIFLGRKFSHYCLGKFLDWISCWVEVEWGVEGFQKHTNNQYNYPNPLTTWLNDAKRFCGKT